MSLRGKVAPGLEALVWMDEERTTIKGQELLSDTGTDGHARKSVRKLGY
jgi:hypothetical protein